MQYICILDTQVMSACVCSCSFRFLVAVWKNDNKLCLKNAPWTLAIFLQNIMVCYSHHHFTGMRHFFFYLCLIMVPAVECGEDIYMLMFWYSILIKVMWYLLIKLMKIDTCPFDHTCKLPYFQSNCRSLNVSVNLNLLKGDNSNNYFNV